MMHNVMSFGLFVVLLAATLGCQLGRSVDQSKPGYVYSTQAQNQALFGAPAAAWMQTEFADEMLEDPDELIELETTTASVSPLWHAGSSTITYGIPLDEHPLVDAWVARLTGRGRRWFSRWRSSASHKNGT